MPDEKLEQIVQRMLDSGESEDNIAAVIKEYSQSVPKAGAPTLSEASGSLLERHPTLAAAGRAVTSALPFAGAVGASLIPGAMEVAPFATPAAGAAVGKGAEDLINEATGLTRPTSPLSKAASMATEAGTSLATGGAMNVVANPVDAARAVARTVGSPIERIGKQAMALRISGLGTLGTGLAIGSPAAVAGGAGLAMSPDLFEAVGGAMRRWGQAPAQLALKREALATLNRLGSDTARKQYLVDYLRSESKTIAPEIKQWMQREIGGLNQNILEGRDAATAEKAAVAGYRKDVRDTTKLTKYETAEANKKAAALRIAQAKEGLEAQPPSVRETISAPGEGGVGRQSMTTTFAPPADEMGGGAEGPDVLGGATPAQRELLSRLPPEAQASVVQQLERAASTRPMPVVRVQPNVPASEMIGGLAPVGSPHVSLEDAQAVLAPAGKVDPSHVRQLEHIRDWYAVKEPATPEEGLLNEGILRMINDALRLGKGGS